MTKDTFISSDKQIPVVLVHGIWDTLREYRNIAGFLRAEGWEVYDGLSLKPNTGSAGLDKLAVQLNEYVCENIGKDKKFNLIGFSMGGLVARYYLQKLDGIRQVEHYISIATPHYGTWLAYALPLEGCRQMRPGSPFLVELNREIQILERIKVTSIWGHYDSTIIPNISSRIPVGREVVLPFVFHPRMLRSEKVIREVSKALGL